MTAASVRRDETLKRYAAHVNPARVGLLSALEIDLVAERSEGYRVWDIDGREFLDLDLRAGVYNLGHRNPDIIASLNDALAHCDMGFALFPGENQARLAEKLCQSSGLSRVLFAASGTEANDMGIQIARRVTGKRRIVSCASGYHGATGLSSAAGNSGFAERFNSSYPQEFVTAPVGDLDALDAELRKGDVAAVMLEPSCNAAGYPSLQAEYWTTVRGLCDLHGVLLIVDEIVTGLGRSGVAWGFQKIGVNPDIAVTAKGLSGGVYPVAAVMLAESASQWLGNDFAGFAGTFTGGELACAVGIRALEISTSDEALTRVQRNMNKFRAGLDELRDQFPCIVEIRQFGLLYALELEQQEGGITLISHLFAEGVLTFPAANAGNVVNVKLGHLVGDDFMDEALGRIERALHLYRDSL